MHILIQWVKLIPKTKFMTYFNLVLENLHNTTDYVLIYEQACCVHEMLKEIDYWLKLSNSSSGAQMISGGFGGSAALSSFRRVNKGEFLDFNDSVTDTTDDHISMSVQIHQN